MLQNSPRISMYVPVGNSSHQGLVTIVTLLVTCGGCVYILSAIADAYSNARSRREQHSRELQCPSECNPSRRWNIYIFYTVIHDKAPFIHNLISIHYILYFVNIVKLNLYNGIIRTINICANKKLHFITSSIALFGRNVGKASYTVKPA